MKTLDEIKQLMAAGETAQADEALKELLAAEPINLQAKMLYGTCRQLLGDGESFRRIHDELVPVMEIKRSDEQDAEELKCWKKYDELFGELNQNALCDGKEEKSPVLEYVVLAILIISAIAAGAIYLGRQVMDQMAAIEASRTAYAGPQYHELVKRGDTQKGTNESVRIETNKNQEVDHAPIELK